jgi:hypothetical protein
MTAIAGRLRLTAAESFWYVLGCIAFGGTYFAKVPAKKALSDAGLAEMTNAERFWYVMQCIAFGAGYFAKIPVKKALTEMTRVPAPGHGLGSGHAAAPGLAGAYGGRGALGAEPDRWAGLPDDQYQSRHGDRGGHA